MSGNSHDPSPQATPDCESQESSDQFVQLLTREQLALFRYITALIGDPDDAGNVLQETNIVLWRKAAAFETGTNFGAWARTIALWQVKAYLRDRGRDRHVFSAELVQQLAERPAVSIDVEPRRRALRRCVKALGKEELELLKQRYNTGYSIAEIADRMKKTPSAIKSGLFRVRRTLRRCVERTVAESV